MTQETPKDWLFKWNGKKLGDKFTCKVKLHHTN